MRGFFLLVLCVWREVAHHWYFSNGWAGLEARLWLVVANSTGWIPRPISGNPERLQGGRLSSAGQPGKPTHDDIWWFGCEELRDGLQ